MENVKWAVLGVAALLVLKYGIVGLDAWNAALHPGRTENDAWTERFRKPLLGVL